MPVFVGAGTSSFLKDTGGVGVTRMNTTTRNNVSGANRVEGQIIYNTDKDALQIWNGSNWAECANLPTAVRNAAAERA